MIWFSDKRDFASTRSRIASILVDGQAAAIEKQSVPPEYASLACASVRTRLGSERMLRLHSFIDRRRESVSSCRDKKIVQHEWNSSAQSLAKRATVLPKMDQ
jgi:hypothetical protein